VEEDGDRRQRRRVESESSLIFDVTVEAFGGVLHLRMTLQRYRVDAKEDVKRR
jgi:hypothetical protein